MATAFRTSLNLCATVTMAAGLLATSAAAESVLVTDPGQRQVRNNGTTDYQGTLGYDITVGSADVQVTHLGVWDGPGNEADTSDGQPGDGLEQSAAVGIYKASDQTLIVQSIVPAGDDAELQGEFRYVALNEPITLAAGEEYRVAMAFNRGGNAFRNYRGGSAAPQFSPHFTVGPVVYHAVGANHETLRFPKDTRNGSAYMGPNFRYTGGVVPGLEPTEDADDRLTEAESWLGMLVLAESFEDFDPSDLPQGWSIKPSRQTGDLYYFSIATLGAGTAGEALQLNQSPQVMEADEFGGLTYQLPQPADRVAITFDYRHFAYQVNSPTLKVFTLGPDSDEPAQLRLRVHRNRLQQNGGIQAGWIDLPTGERQSGRQITDAPWYRVRFIIDRNAHGMDVYISKPDQPDLPSTPVATVPVYQPGEAIAAIRFGMAHLRNNHYLIDNLEIRTGEQIDAPGEPEIKPDLSKGLQFWTGDSFPRTFSEISYPQGIEHHIVSPKHGDWSWFHGAAIEAHKGKLYASWGANTGHENSKGEVVLVTESSDDGKTWTEPKVLAAGDGEYSNSHGTLLSHNGKLWSFNQHWLGGWDNPLSTEAFVLNEQSGEWESQGVVATQGWPLDRPKQTADGNWVMGVSGFLMRRPAAMISHGDDLTRWDTVAIPTDRDGMFAETSLIADGNHVWSITRWGDGRALMSTSSDGGRTWDKAQRSNLPMAGSKPDSGTLSTGQPYAVINMEDRDALMICVGQPGEKGLSAIYKVRYGSPPTEHPYQGSEFPRAYAYPYSTEHDGKLYVIYSVSKGDVEMAVIPVASLSAD